MRKSLEKNMQAICFFLVLCCFSSMTALAQNRNYFCDEFIESSACNKESQLLGTRKVKTLMDRSYRNFKKQRYLSAYLYAKEVQVIAPQYKPAHEIMILALTFNGRYRDAYRQLMRFPRQREKIRPFIIGYILYNNNKYRLASRIFRTVPRSSPFYSISQFYLAISLIKSHQFNSGLRRLRNTDNLPNALTAYKLNQLGFLVENYSPKRGEVLPLVIDLAYLVNFVRDREYRLGRDLSQDEILFVHNSLRKRKRPKRDRVLAKKPETVRETAFTYQFVSSGLIDASQSSSESIDKTKSSLDEYSQEAALSASMQYSLPFYSDSILMGLSSSARQSHEDLGDDDFTLTTKTESYSINPKFSLILSVGSLQISKKFTNETSIDDGDEIKSEKLDTVYSISVGESWLTLKLSQVQNDETDEDGETIDETVNTSIHISGRTDKIITSFIISKESDKFEDREKTSHSLTSTYSIHNNFDTSYSYRTTSNTSYQDTDIKFEKRHSHSISFSYSLWDDAINFEGTFERAEVNDYGQLSKVDDKSINTDLDGIVTSGSLDVTASLGEYFSINGAYNIDRYDWDSLPEDSVSINSNTLLSKDETWTVSISLDLTL